METYINRLSSVCPHGTSTSQTYQIDRLCDNDVFLVESGNRSLGVTYAELMELTIQNLYSEKIGVKSMAFRNKYEYSLSSHIHNDLNRLSVSDTVGDSNPFDVSTKGVSSERTFCVRADTIVIGKPPVRPKVGTVKFVYGKRLQQKFPDCIRNGTFDGWVYVNPTAE